MKNLNNKGFGAVAAVLIVLILAIIGGSGFYVYKIQQNTNETLDNTGNSEIIKTDDKKDTSEKPDETSGWTSFAPDSKKYTIKLPDGWTFLHQNDDCDCIYSQSMKYEQGKPATIETIQGGRDGITGYFIATDEKDLSKERFSGLTQTGTKTIGDFKVTEYFHEQKTEPDGIGLPKGGKEYSYYLVGGGKYIYISYSVLPGQENNLELVEKSIQTIE